jgi:hypothetical protein
MAHIGRNGALEDHQQAERRLVEEELNSRDQTDMFATACSFPEMLGQAYATRACSIAYRREHP